MLVFAEATKVTDSSVSAVLAVSEADSQPFQRKPSQRLRLVAPAGTPPAFKAAVDNGADDVYLGLRGETNARNFAALNFDAQSLAEAVRYAHQRKASVLLALNTYPQSESAAKWKSTVDIAADAGVDALIVADPGVMRHANTHHPRLRLHLSVQGSATSHEAINFYHEHFGVARAVLPRVLSMGQIETLIARTPVEIEVFGFGSLCIMVEGRCALSSYVTGESPNTRGGCSPAKAIRWEERSDGLRSRLNGVLVDRFAPEENAGYPTLCHGRFKVGDEVYYPFEEPTSLNALELLPRLQGMGVHAIKIEGRQRTTAYVALVTRIWREALDDCARSPARFLLKPAWQEALAGVAEGRQCTLGAYERPWK
jgi:putative protease